MKLKIKTRLARTKKETNDIRRNGDIPAVLYAKSQSNRLIEVSGVEFLAHLRQMPKGNLPNTLFELVDEKGKSCKALVKEIQYHPTTYNVLHLDFVLLQDSLPVNVKVPLRFTGAADCVGVKLGGVLRTVIRHMKVRCLPEHIPHEFNIDVTEMGINHSKRLSAIELPENVKSLLDLNEVAVVIAKR
jgi:large subunit ribosomal protein L25